MENVTWTLLLGLSGFGLTVLVSFATLIVAIGKKFDDANTASETRAAALHHRINDMDERMRHLYLPRETFASEIKRLDAAQDERDRQLAELSDRMSCPARDR